MPPDENETIDYLEENYTGALAARALWVWAGGDPNDVIYADDPNEQWPLMWDAAGAKGKPSRIALLREALFDRPGDGTLLKILTALGQESVPDGKYMAQILAVLLEKTAPEHEPDALWSAMQVFSESPLDVGFALLAEAFQDRFSTDSRERLVERFAALETNAKIPAVGIAAVSFETLLGMIPELVENGDTPEYQVLAEKIKTAMKPAHDLKTGAQRKMKTDMEPLLQSLESLGVESKDRLYAAAVKGLKRQFVRILEIMAQEPAPNVESLCRAGVQAVWGTKGPKGDESQDPA